LTDEEFVYGSYSVVFMDLNNYFLAILET